MKPEQTLTLTCESCNKVHKLEKTNELPSHVFFMRCNWCPCCEGTVDDYYNEWWDEDENDPNKPLPIPEDPNQLCLPLSDIFQMAEPKKELQLV